MIASWGSEQGLMRGGKILGRLDDFSFYNDYTGQVQREMDATSEL